MILGVILARGGSKRLPGKNIRPFAGKPLIVWSIEAARDSVIDETVVSTDDPQIAAVALAAGVRVIERPAHLATDAASSEDAVRHVMGLVQSDWIVLLQPTSPLRHAADIDACIWMAQSKNESVVSYCNGKKNGAVYVSPTPWLVDHGFGDAHQAYEMPPECSIDIDTQADFDRAEQIALTRG